MRVYLFFDQEFPRKGPDSNYVHYLSLAIENAGYDVIIVGESTSLRKNTNLKKLTAKISYVNISLSSRIKRYWCRFFSYGQNFEFLDIHPDDIIIFYTEYGSKINTVLKKHSVRIENRILISVEWLQDFYPKKNSNKLKYLRYKYFEYISAKYIRKVLPISTKLRDYYESKGYETMLLPVLNNPFEINNPTNSCSEMITFLYSGISLEKDDYRGMFLTVNHLYRYTSNIRLIITNSDSEKIRHLMGEELFSSLKNILNIYSWLPYEQYMNILDEADFLLVFRSDTNITRANMPSKVPEALSRGIVPIISNGGDLSNLYLTDLVDSIILDGSGNYEEHAKKIYRVIMEQKHMFENIHVEARKTAEEKFYYKNWSDKIVEFIERKVCVSET